MSRLEAAAARYARTAGLMKNGVELDIVADPVGARLNGAVLQLHLLARDDVTTMWDEVLAPARALRWRVLTQPQPIEFGSVVQQAAAEVAAKACSLRNAVGTRASCVLEELAAAAEALSESDPAVGAVLLESIEEASVEASVVIAASASAAGGLERWLGPRGFRVRTVTEMLREQLFVECGYAVGPPRFFPSSLVTAPMSETLNFVFPAWFGDRSLPRSTFAARAEGAIAISGIEFPIGVFDDPGFVALEDPVDEVALLPQTTWLPPASPPREPGPEEVAAWKLLLSGGFSMWLDDDGEWIRAVDPAQQSGGRVINIDVEAVRPGVFLLLRDGQTERRALYDAALQLLGTQGELVGQSQSEWKGALKDRLDRLGRATVIRQLGAEGVRTLDRVPAWTDPLLARPQSNQDFERLLLWLGIKPHPTYELATQLRSLRGKVSNQIGEQLEAVVAGADMSRLEREGHLRLELDAEGFRGVIATRVVGKSPHTENIPRGEARVLRPDRGATWQE